MITQSRKVPQGLHPLLLGLGLISLTSSGCFWFEPPPVEEAFPTPEPTAPPLPTATPLPTPTPEPEAPTPPPCTETPSAPLQLLLNGSAEHGTACWQSDAPWVSVQDDPENNFYAALGSHLFFAGESDVATLSQTIDLVAAGVSTADIDAGHMALIAGGYQDSYQFITGTDVGQIWVTVLNAEGRRIAQSYGPQLNYTAWTYVRFSIPLPAGARQVIYNFTSTRIDGSDNDNYLDGAFVWVDRDADGDGAGPATGDCDDQDPRASADHPEDCDNLLANPGGEAGLAGWTASSSFKAKLSATAAEGIYYFAAGDEALATLSQTVDLVASGYTEEELEAGHFTLVAGGQQRSLNEDYAWNYDMGQLMIDVLDESGATVQHIDGPRVQFIRDWMYTEMIEPLSPHARKLVYTFQAHKSYVDEEANDAYLDAAFLRLE